MSCLPAGSDKADLFINELHYTDSDSVRSTHDTVTDVNLILPCFISLHMEAIDERTDGYHGT
jgi:hypothetical protein